MEHASLCLEPPREQDDGKRKAPEVEARLETIEADTAGTVHAEEHADTEHDEENGGTGLSGERHERKRGKHNHAREKDYQFHCHSFNRAPRQAAPARPHS